MSIVWNTILKMDTKHSRTNTTLFLLPLLGDSRDYLTNHNNWFINSYLKDDCIVLIYSYNSVEVLEYKMLTPDVKETIKYFTEGCYSQIPDKHKQTILKFWDAKKGSKLHNILYPEYFHMENYGRPIKAEIWPKPNMELETYKP